LSKRRPLVRKTWKKIKAKGNTEARPDLSPEGKPGVMTNRHLVRGKKGSSYGNPNRLKEGGGRPGKCCRKSWQNHSKERYERLGEKITLEQTKE